MTIGQLLTLTASKFPDRIALLFEDRKFTYREFNRRVNQFAQTLLRFGLRKGEKVAVLLFNSNHSVEAYLGTAKAGGVFTPINFRLAGEEVFYTLDHSDARFFCSQRIFLGQWPKSAPNYPELIFSSPPEISCSPALSITKPS